MWELSTKVQNSHLSLSRALSLFLLLSSAWCIPLSLITAFQWHLTSFANVTWGQSPVSCVCAATTHVLLRLVRALRRYFWMLLFSSCCSGTAGNWTSANSKLSHRPQTLPVRMHNKPYKREFTKTKQHKAFANLTAAVTSTDGNKSISILFSLLDDTCT